MARKKSTNRPNLPETALEQARREASGTAFQAAKPQQAAAPVAAAARTTMDDLAREYAYVVTDLRNMGILAALLFVFLVVLALVL